MKQEKKSGRKPTGRVRLADIAKHCNLSISTVSRVISNRTDQFPIAEDTIERIHQTARELGYRPNRLARAIAYQKTNLIGLSVPHYKTRENCSFEEETYLLAKVFGLLSSGVLDNPKMLDYDLVIHDRQKFSGSSQDYYHSQDGLLDGIIYNNPSKNSIPFITETARTIPVVIIGSIPEVESQFISVDIDNRAAVRSCVKHLYDIGCKKPLVLIPEELKKFFCITDRLDGYIEAFKDYGYSTSEENIYSVKQNPDAVHSLLAGIKNIRKYDAIIAPFDELIFYCIDPLKELGIRIPQDIALIGFDDSDRCLSSTPRLTSIRTPFHALGFKATDLLIDILNGKQLYIPGKHTIETELIIRESTQR
ncbi:MAG: LacI family DNA-binding transcriptional regulator [Kiritimatiellales bacterium]